VLLLIYNQQLRFIIGTGVLTSTLIEFLSALGHVEGSRARILLSPVLVAGFNVAAVDLESALLLLRLHQKVLSSSPWLVLAIR